MIALFKSVKLHQSYSLRFWLNLGLMVSFWGLTTPRSHADGYFSASNLGGSAIIEYDAPLSKAVGMVEILDGETVLARGRLVKDGFFALGTVYVPGPGMTRVITVRVWDMSSGTTFEAAREALDGRGTPSDKVTVTLSSGINPPRGLNTFGYYPSFLFSPNPEVPFAYNPILYSPWLPNSFLDPAGGQPAQLRAQLLRPIANRPAIPLSSQTQPPVRPGIYTGGLRWFYSSGHWEAGAILRLWDASTGETYELAKLRGASSVSLYGTPWDATVRTLDPATVKMVRATEVSIGKFQAPGGTVRVLGTDGGPIPKGHWQVEILAGKNQLQSFALPDSGTFPLPPTAVPGTLPLDIADVTLRIWDPTNSDTFENGPVIGLLTERLALGGDNLPAATLSTNVVRLSSRPATPPEIVPSVRRRLSSAAREHQTLAVTAFGPTLHYQWQFSGPEGLWSNLADGPSITGTQSATLELNRVSPDQAGVYRAIVSNPLGAAANTPVELYVHDLAPIHFSPTPTFQFGTRSVVQAIADSQRPTLIRVVSGPATATLLPDGHTQIEPTGTGPLVLRATEASPSPYAILYADFTFQIDKAPQSIAFADLPAELTPNASLRIVATADSGLRVSVNVVSGPGRLDNGNVLQVLGPGLITLAATQPGDANYLPASITRSIQVVEVPPAARIVESGPGFALIFRGESGRIHVVESTESLTGVWQEVARKPGSGPTLDTIVTLPPASDSVRFYRLRFE